MSGRRNYLKIKSWEIEGLKSFCARLADVMEEAEELYFYYSFVMPKLGKEFDLLRVNDGSVVNVELKSGEVSDETIRKQLLQNRYYLATLGKSMYSYTYVSGIGRLVRLSNSGRLVEADWEELAQVLERQTDCYDGHIEELFKEDRYLISPLTDPGRFLRREYFLTAQQKDIKKQILWRIREITIGGTGASGQKLSKQNTPGQAVPEQTTSSWPLLQGFTGLPGTGKTLLLYDMAMELSWREKVCVLHFGAHEKELEQLDERLKRIDFYYCDPAKAISVEGRYCAILVDEGHRIGEAALASILECAEKWNAPVIFSYDCEDMISPKERVQDGAGLIEATEGFVKYHLTNRIRMNSELSAFIGCAVYLRNGNHRQEYPSVALAYACDEAEEKRLLHVFEKKGYTCIRDAVTASCREFDRVVMLIDDSFAYDEEGYLRCTVCNSADTVENREGENRSISGVRNLFHGLSRAKKSIAVIVRNNEIVFETLLSVIQKQSNFSH